MTIGIPSESILWVDWNVGVQVSVVPSSFHFASFVESFCKWLHTVPQIVKIFRWAFSFASRAELFVYNALGFFHLKVVPYHLDVVQV